MTATERSRSCVIVTHNSAEFIEKCLEPLRAEDVIIVDNASSDGTLGKLCSGPSTPEVIRLPVNVGFARAANIGFKRAGRRDVVLLNPDARITTEALDALASTARTLRAGIVAPRLLHEDGRVQDSARTFPTVWSLVARRTPFARTRAGAAIQGAHTRPSYGDGPGNADWVIGACMYIPRRALDRVGGFDERFFLYGEDVDLCARMWAAGLPVVLDRDVVAEHVYARSSKRTFDLRQAPTRHHWASMARLGRRYPRSFFSGRRPEAKVKESLTAREMNGALAPAGPAPLPHLRGEVPLPMLALERARQMIELYGNWPAAVGDRLGVLRQKEVVYRVRKDFGSALLLARTNGCDVRTITEVWVGELYTRYMTELEGTGPFTFVDIGSNCGYFAVYAGLRWPESRIVCVEPEPDNYRIAVENLKMNVVNAEVLKFAVVPDTRTRVKLHLSANPRFHTTVTAERAGERGIENGRYSGSSIDVPAKNINDLILALARSENRPLVVKIDVEGIELDLVGTLSEDALIAIQYLAVETEGQDTSVVVRSLKRHQFCTEEFAGLLVAWKPRQRL